MSTKSIVLAVVVALVVGGFAGYAVAPKNLGVASIAPYNCLNQQILCNEIQSIANPLTGWNASSSQFNGVILGQIGSTTSTASTTITVTGASVGDYLEYGESTSSVSALLGCVVTAANTAVCYKQNMQAGQATVATSTVFVLDVPKASFVSPSGL